MSIVTLSLAALGAWGVIANKVGTSRIAELFDAAQAATDGVSPLRESLFKLRLPTPTRWNAPSGCWKAEGQTAAKLAALLC
jgi:hypothetical protein